ncbi:hypothetical protein BH24CHL9_BH24CHL9_00090 [soil metagenome]
MPADIPVPYRLQAQGDHAAAAHAWEAIGCPYQQALALAESDDEPDLHAAHAILLRLEARPMAHQVAGRLRSRGARGIARGARRSTRRNPAGLTSREVEVLSLLAVGLRNADIAERLVVSVKTVDHHVSAVLRKLGVRDRVQAGREAVRLGLKDGGLSTER